MPTIQSLNNLYNYLSKTHGQNVSVSGEYYQDADYQKINNFAETQMKNPGCWGFGHTCQDFAKGAIDAAR